MPGYSTIAQKYYILYCSTGGHFNAAPTLLEQQQEKMSERSRCLQRTISCDSRVIERLGVGVGATVGATPATGNKLDKTSTTGSRRDGA